MDGKEAAGMAQVKSLRSELLSPVGILRQLEAQAGLFL